MARYRHITSTESIQKRIKEGRCLKDGKEYIPWIKVPEIPSRGTSLRTYNIQTQRQHHMLSRLESFYYMTLEWYEDVIKDIKEQYAILNMDETIQIAHEIGVKHPAAPKTKVIVPITTDFLIEIQVDDKTKTIARTVKYEKDLLKKRTREKLEIERIYYERHGIDWGIITEKNIDKVFIGNIIWVRKAKSLDGVPELDIDKIIHIEESMRRAILQNNKEIAKIASTISDEYGMSSGTGMFIVRFLIANKIWQVDMHQPITPITQLNLLKLDINKLYKMKTR
ncbi:TnsA endonuclease N-terminal domain-containing protein [Petroclostridium sp. X23]|uniref:TnsA endonuclease N-terminal domain-containing protein n=1 Tax=Petroclostridium sp. X23 TaxID=3045146 RepID=UPI0024ADCB60|nr:TnsA endonuclease N-terminal domain-containing protein [Petroclostridium sp. X23]WHH60978.1 TnsA endonuclease N-terminal domain-containing protein [Petroclostridium sp. X23]